VLRWRRGFDWQPMRKLHPLLAEYVSELPGLFIVSQVELSNHTTGNHTTEGLDVKIERRSVRSASGAGSIQRTSVRRRSYLRYARLRGAVTGNDRNG